MVRQRWWLAGALAAVVVAAAAPGHARTAEHQTTYLTFSTAVALPGTVLPAGTYRFELANPWSDQYTVVVRSGDGQRLQYLGMTRPLARPQHLRESTAVLLGEAPVGTPAPIVAWFPPNDSHGRRFVYRQ